MATVSISSPAPSDRDDFLAAVSRSRELHCDWVTPPATQQAFDKYLELASAPDHLAFFIRRVEDGELAGVVNVSRLVGEPLSSAFLGFYALEPYARRGYMHSGLRLVLAHAFNERKLHRIEANIQPANGASIGLVRKLGFRREGFSPKYLRIAGEWRDHERWALLAEEFKMI